MNTSIAYLYSEANSEGDNVSQKKYVDLTHKAIINAFKKFPLPREGLKKERADYSINFYLVWEKGRETFEVNGPSYSKKYKCCDYSVFLPNELRDVVEYLDVLCQAILLVFPNYDVDRFKKCCMIKSDGL